MHRTSSGEKQGIEIVKEKKLGKAKRRTVESNIAAPRDPGDGCCKAKPVIPIDFAKQSDVCRTRASFSPHLRTFRHGYPTTGALNMEGLKALDHLVVNLPYTKPNLTCDLSITFSSPTINIQD
ncbi:hypothetical protein PoB_000389200 [Plakobranchus ocellatus]|uniref:Uncharacterized protein n=1 Tax=Plakobranchus ocellatus TaxID=259542 RepID=A0AAV3Y3V2_9GAST|nr:hypothetical protein PoB_000389200 [Plakobranchus ocellatus]